MKLHGYDNLMNYIDDLIYIRLSSKIHQSIFAISLARFIHAGKSEQTCITTY